MALTARRARLATGVYRDAAGVIIRVPGKPPADHRHDKDGVRYETHYATRGITWLRQERLRLCAAATLRAERRAESSESFRADVQTFLASISGAGHRLNTQGYMAHWEQHFADRRRNEITDLDAQTAFAQMRTLADSTRIHVRRALIQFYAALNGPSGYNPGRALKKPAKPAEPIRDLPWSDIEALFHALPPSRTKARLMLIAYIGLPQKQIAALRPSDLRLDRRELVVHPRRKGAGVSGRVQPLSDVGIAALREFARLQAFGTFQNRQLVETFRSGAKKAGITLPDGARPYDLRHSFLTELARSGADIRDIAHLGMHATLEQAARYVKGAAAERATNAITSVPRFCATTTRRNRPIRSSSVHRQGQPQPAPQRPTRGKKLRISSGKL